MDHIKGGNDIMIKNLQDFGITEEQFRQLMADYPKSAEFLEQHIREDDTLDFLGNQALAEMIKNNQTAMPEDNDFMNSPEKQNDEINSETENGTEAEYELTEADTESNQIAEDSSENKPAYKEEIVEEKQTTNVQEDEPEKNEKNAAQRPKQKRKRKVATKFSVDIPSAIDRVPATDLRKFYAQNFAIKPEKIFYLDDESIRKNVNEKYFCLETQDRFVLFKKNTTMISIDKTISIEVEE